MAKRKRAPGSARARAAKKAQAAAARARAGDYAAIWRARYAALATAEARPANASTAFNWLAKVMLLAIEEAALDEGLAPEARREQLGRLVAQAAKVMDPARMAEEIEALELALQEAEQHAGDVPTAEARPS